MDEKLEILKSGLTFWDKLQQNEKDLILERTRLVKQEKGTILYFGGGECSGLEVIKSGHIRVFIMSAKGGEITLYRLLPGDSCILSTACMFKNLDFEIHMEMVQDSEIYIIPRQIYKEISDKNSSVKDYTLESISARFTDVMNILSQFVFSNVASRLAALLIEYQKIQNKDQIKITHSELANDLGTAREVITRLLKQLQADGLVEVSRGSILILDKVRLNQI